MKSLTDNGLAIPSIIAFELNETKPWFVMPWFSQGSLETKISAGLTTDPVSGLNLLIELAQILHTIHEARVAHRDLKPANVLIDDDEKLLVTDFGLCLDVDGIRLTETLEAVGSRLYIAPENESGIAEEVDQRPADFYAFGKICWSVLAGRSALAREQQLELKWRLATIHDDRRWQGCDSLFELLLNNDPRARLNKWTLVISELKLTRNRFAQADQNEAPAFPVGDYLTRAAATLERIQSSEETLRKQRLRERSQWLAGQRASTVLTLNSAMRSQLSAFLDSMDGKSTEFNFFLSSGGVSLGTVLDEDGENFEQIPRSEIAPERVRHATADVLVSGSSSDGSHPFPLYVEFYYLVYGDEVRFIRALHLNDNPQSRMVHVKVPGMYPYATPTSALVGSPSVGELAHDFAIQSRDITIRTVAAYIELLTMGHNNIDDFIDELVSMINPPISGQP